MYVFVYHVGGLDCIVFLWLWLPETKRTDYCCFVNVHIRSCDGVGRVLSLRNLLLLPLFNSAVIGGKKYTCRFTLSVPNLTKGLLGEHEMGLCMFEAMQQTFVRCWNWFHMSRGPNCVSRSSNQIKWRKRGKQKRRDPVVALILNLIKVPKEVKIEKSSVLAFVFLNSSLGWCVMLVCTVRAAACTSTVSVKHLLDITWRSFKHLALHVFMSPCMYVCTSTVYIHVCKLWHGNLPVALSVSA